MRVVQTNWLGLLAQTMASSWVRLGSHGVAPCKLHSLCVRSRAIS